PGRILTIQHSFSRSQKRWKCSKPGNAAGCVRAASANDTGSAPPVPPSDAPVNGLTDEAIVVADLEEALGVAEEEQIAGALQPGDARKELPLGILVEIDDDVPAED